METSIQRLKILVPDPRKYGHDISIRSYLSFGPYYRYLQKRLQNEKEQFADFYRYITAQLEANPELLKPLQNLEVIQQHKNLFQIIASSLFPFSRDPNLQYYTLSTPYKYENFFYSASFSDYFVPDDDGYVIFPPERPFEQLMLEFSQLAYRMVFRKFYQVELLVTERKKHLYINKETGLRRYSRIHFDESFIDVSVEGQLPPFPESLVNRQTGLVRDMKKLEKVLPLSHFIFEGFFIRRSIGDVTAEECVTEVKNALIEMQSDAAGPGYDKLRAAIETMLGLKHVEVSLSPFLKLNEKYVYYERYAGQSILIKALSKAGQQEAAYSILADWLVQDKKPLYVPDTRQSSSFVLESGIAEYLSHLPAACYLVAPLFEQGELIGMMEAVSPLAGGLHPEDLKKLEPLDAFFEMACRNHLVRFRSEIEGLVKEQFTALQPIVEWKFLNEAWKYLRQREKGMSADMGTIRFDQVFPVYGAVDIRNSSVIRNRCHHDDLADQLTQIESVIRQIAENPHPSVQEHLVMMLEKNSAFLRKTAEDLNPEDEAKVNDYLELEVRSFFRHLAHTGESCYQPVKQYLDQTEHANGHFTRHRKDFEVSLSAINTAISRYLDEEQVKIQQLYPHYFEKFRTDGVEYNIYLGESFTPNKSFDILFLKSVRLWQLQTMIDIAHMTARMAKEIPLPLQTTQLVLAFGSPICISFRKDERRFDVEGEESIRFEILKKRIDKSRVKETGERLTQPGTIAIIYTHQRDAGEYEDYFHMLNQRSHHLLKKELLDLEDLQGISGLKALRFTVSEA